MAAATLKVTFWGVRGSIPAPGPETNRYGGNTACISVEKDDGGLLILDTGTGATVLGRQMMDGPFGRGNGRATILLSHAHWDHIQGFPFFAPVFVPGNEFHIYGYSRTPNRLEAVLEGQMSPQFSPVQSLKNLGASIYFHSLTAGASLNVDGVTIKGEEVEHGVTTALTFRLQTAAGKVVVYATDAGYPESNIPDRLVAHYKDADLLIHDCTYSPEDQAERRNRGFSSIADAARAAVAARVKHLAMIHYDQDYTDTEVDALKARLRKLLDEMGGAGIKLTAAAEGLTLSI